MEADLIEKMYVEILLGTKKARSLYVVDELSGRVWDQISREVATIKAKHPDAQFDIPSEMPEATPPASIAGRV